MTEASAIGVQDAMPKLKCPDFSKKTNKGRNSTVPYMRLIESSGIIIDSRGRKRPCYLIYNCDCGKRHIYDAWMRTWKGSDDVDA